MSLPPEQVRLAQSPWAELPFGEGAWPRFAWVVGLVYLAIVVSGLVASVPLLARVPDAARRWPEQAGWLRSRPWTREHGLFILLALLVLYAVGTLLQSLVQRLPGVDETARSTMGIVAQTIVFHLAGLLMVAVTLRRRGLSWGGAFGIRGSRWVVRAGTGAVLYLAVMPVVAFYAVLHQGVLRHFGYQPFPQDIALAFVRETSLWVRIYVVGLAAVLAPLFEEVLFRGIALPLLARRWGVGPAVFAVSALFAAIHFHLPSFVPLFVIAVAFSLGYIHSQSLLVPIVMHGLFNAVNLGLLFLLRPG
jgi:membrane protease YdiL (CAAX protease family)